MRKPYYSLLSKAPEGASGRDPVRVLPWRIMGLRTHAYKTLQVP